MKKIKYILIFLLSLNSLSLSQPIPFPDIIIPDYNNIKEFPKQNNINQIPNEIVLVDGKKYNIDYSWVNAEIYTPENKSSTKITNISSEKKYPVLILMHGCNGINNHVRDWAYFFNSFGYAVILPNSLAIPGRSSWCNVSTKTFDESKGQIAYKIRSTEAAYTMAKLQDFSWVDKKKIFIMGHSEGGVALNFITDERFKGIIFSGSPCNVSYYMRNSKIPILAINWTKDTWIGHLGLCKDNWGEQINATQVILEGSGHDTAYSEIAQNGVKDFLKKYSK
jgi:dienelactone hydrolase